MLPKPPKIAAVRGAISVPGISGQIGPFRCLAGAAALDRGRVGDPHLLRPESGAALGVGEDRLHGACKLAQSLVVSGLACKRGEHVDHPEVDMPQPPPLGRESDQRLLDCDGDQLHIRDPQDQANPGRHSYRAVVLQEVISRDVECGSEDVRVFQASGLRSVFSSLDPGHPPPQLEGGTPTSAPGIAHLGFLERGRRSHLEWLCDISLCPEAY